MKQFLLLRNYAIVGYQTTGRFFEMTFIAANTLREMLDTELDDPVWIEVATRKPPVSAFQWKRLVLRKVREEGESESWWEWERDPSNLAFCEKLFEKAFPEARGKKKITLYLKIG